MGFCCYPFNCRLLFPSLVSPPRRRKIGTQRETIWRVATLLGQPSPIGTSGRIQDTVPCGCLFLLAGDWQVGALLGELCSPPAGLVCLPPSITRISMHATPIFVHCYMKMACGQTAACSVALRQCGLIPRGPCDIRRGASSLPWPVRSWPRIRRRRSRMLPIARSTATPSISSCPTRCSPGRHGNTCRGLKSEWSSAETRFSCGARCR